MEKNVAIVLAAGKGSRMGTEVPKQFLEIQGKPVLYYSLKTFQDSPLIDEIILVVNKEYQKYCEEEIVRLYGLTKVSRMVEGGAERYDSVYAGLQACEGCDYVFIHDGARPFVTQAMIERCMDTVRESAACVVGMPVKDTIKIADDHGDIAVTPPREKVWMIQTPQVFDYDLVFRSYTKMLEDRASGITDDAMVVEFYGNKKIRLVPGDYENIKITTPEDIQIARMFLEENDENTGRKNVEEKMKKR